MQVSIRTAGTLGLRVGPALGELVLLVGLLWIRKFGQMRLIFKLSSGDPPFLRLFELQAWGVAPQPVRQAEPSQPPGQSSSCWEWGLLHSLSLLVALVLVSVESWSCLVREHSDLPAGGWPQSPGWKAIFDLE